MTTIILWVMHYIPGLSLRCNEEAERVGIDDYDMGEFAYDYVGQDIGVNDVEGGEEQERINPSGSREPHHMDGDSGGASDFEMKLRHAT